MKETNLRSGKQTCPLCGSDNRKKMPHYAKLYGHYVCRKCYFGFANRRQFAFLIDIILLSLVRSGIDWFRGIGFWEDEPGLTVGSFTLSCAMVVIFLVKDGFRGQSPGRALLGIQVIDEKTGRPAGFLASFKRNLPVLILIPPFVWVFVAFQLVKGHRLGDKWANTKVIWKKYRHKAPFAV